MRGRECLPQEEERWWRAPPGHVWGLGVRRHALMTSALVDGWEQHRGHGAAQRERLAGRLHRAHLRQREEEDVLQTGGRLVHR